MLVNLMFCNNIIEKSEDCGVKRFKRTRWMPWQSKAMKDVLICEKHRRADVKRY